MDENSLVTAVFGDIHGEITLLYDSCRAWQEQYDRKIDLILQVGDLGVISNVSSLPTSQKRKIRENPHELDLYYALRHRSEFEEYVKDIDARLVFVDGNHDDHSYLEALMKRHEGQNLVPLNEKIAYLRDCKPVRFAGANPITIAGLGGIEKYSRPKQAQRDARIAFTDEEVSEALNCESVDVFLTHMHPSTIGYEGSSQLAELIRIIQPDFYFFGHLDKASSFSIGNTRCFGLPRVRYNSLDNLRARSMIVFEKRGDGIEIIDNDS